MKDILFLLPYIFILYLYGVFMGYEASTILSDSEAWRFIIFVIVTFPIYALVTKPIWNKKRHSV